MNLKHKVTIGIPIYKGEVFLKETLDNILSQTFKNYEILISDNNPGGEPELIAEEYAKRYEFITYIKQEKNRGALQNWNFLLEKAEGKYFIYAGGHDLWTKDFLECLYNFLENNNDFVLAYAPSVYIERNGQITNKNTAFVDTSGLTLVERFNALGWVSEEAIYGLVRTECAKRTRLQKETMSSGLVWLSELLFYGHFKVCSNILRYRRINRNTEKNINDSLKRYYGTLFSKKVKIFFPWFRLFWAYQTVVFRYKIKFMTKLRLSLSVLHIMFARFSFLLFKL